MTDTFRKEYSNDESLKDFVYEIKDRAQDLEEHIKVMPHCRERSIALTKLEECIMWATKAVYSSEHKAKPVKEQYT